MEINKIKITYEKKGEKFRIIPIGDLHIGNAGCDIKKIKALIDWIAEKENTFWIGMGDYLEAINYTDKRFDPTAVAKKFLNCLDNLVEEQKNEFINLFEKIKHKCIGLHAGNHEEAIRRFYHIDVTEEIAKEFNVKNLRYSAFTTLQFIRGKDNWKTKATRNFVIFSTHGRAGGRRGGNKINRLEDLMAWFDADIYLLGHAHKKILTTISQLSINGKKKQQLIYKKKIGGVTGSFLQGYALGSTTSYVERYEYPPTDLGVIKITIIPDTGDIHASE
ncbi:MAG: metallophosphoesterase [Thermoplasmatales archaeon]|nr:metallophosphoesterase [Thermoplasmatales archaeon]